jgi:hypothetical protein
MKRTPSQTAFLVALSMGLCHGASYLLYTRARVA